MFREMRRKDRVMDEAKIEQILTDGSYGLMGLTLPDGYPYAVPVNYVYVDQALYVHCAGEGQKIDAIKANDKACFTIVNRENVIASKFTTSYESVMVFGSAEILSQNSDEHKTVLKAFIEKYAPKHLTSGFEYVERAHAQTTLIKLTIAYKSGKVNDKKEEE